MKHEKNLEGLGQNIWSNRHKAWRAKRAWLGQVSERKGVRCQITRILQQEVWALL